MVMRVYTAKNLAPMEMAMAADHQPNVTEAPSLITDQGCSPAPTGPRLPRRV